MYFSFNVTFYKFNDVILPKITKKGRIMKESRQLDIFLANTLGITERGVKTMRQENNKRYQRELIGALILSTGISLDKVVHGFMKNKYVTVLDMVTKNTIESIDTLMAGKNKIKPSIQPEDAVFIQRYLGTFFKGFYTDDENFLNFTIYYDELIGYIPTLEIASKDILSSEFGYIESIELDLIPNQDYPDKLITMPEIVDYIFKRFPTLKKRNYPLHEIELTQKIKSLSPNEILERHESVYPSFGLIHSLDYCDIYYKGIRIRREETIDGTLDYMTELEYAGKKYILRHKEEDFSVEDFTGKLLEFYADMQIEGAALKSLESAIEKMYKVRENNLEYEKNGEDFDEQTSGFKLNVLAVFLEGIQEGLANAIHSKELEDIAFNYSYSLMDPLTEEALQDEAEISIKTITVKVPKCIELGRPQNQTEGELDE